MTSTRGMMLLSVVAMTILAPEPILARRSMTIRMPKFDVRPRSDREICTFVPLPARQPGNLADVIVLSEDDMCILPGYYYDADPAAPAGQECVL